MKKKLISFVLCMTMLLSISLAAHATENLDEAAIEPFASTFVLNLTTSNYSAIYSDTIPVLLPTTITVTNPEANPGAIIARVLDEKNKVIVDEQIINAGVAYTLTIKPDLLGLWQGDYSLQVKAAMNNGVYGVSVNKGNTGENIKVIHANTSEYTYTGDLPYSTNGEKVYTITNHTLSPGSVALLLRGANSGGIFNDMLTSPTLAPGQSTTVTIQSKVNEDIILDAMALSIEGTYFLTINEVK